VIALYLRKILFFIFLLGISVALSQKTEIIEPILISSDYKMSDVLPIGYKLQDLFDSSLKKASIPTGRQIVWLVSTDFAESNENPISTDGSGNDKRENYGNFVIDFLPRTSIKQNIIFYESRNANIISGLDFKKIEKRFRGFNIFFDKENVFEESNQGIIQSHYGLYLLDNNLVKCKFLNISDESVKKIVNTFLNSGNLLSCPNKISVGSKVNGLKFPSIFMTLQGTEYKLNAKDFKITRITNKDGTQEENYSGKIESSARFIIERVDYLAKKFKIKPIARVLNFEEIDKMKLAFPNWEFIPFYGGYNEIIWSNLGVSVAIINAKSEISANILVYAGTESAGNDTLLQIAMREARRK
jgi:hypothetical protein